MIEIFEWDLRDETPRDWLNHYVVFEDKKFICFIMYKNNEFNYDKPGKDMYEIAYECDRWIKISITLDELKAKYL